MENKHFIRLVVILVAVKGNNGGITSRIYQGTEAARDQFPFMAKTLMTSESNTYASCGGSLINEQWVVSAAHCAVGAVEVTITLGLLNQNDQDNVVTYKVPKDGGIFIHPDYSPDKSPSPDIVLYKLPDPVSFDEHPNIKAVKIPDVGPDSVSDYDGQLVTTAGWGDTGYGEGSETLLYAIIKVLANSVCIEKIPPGATTSTICTEREYKNSSPCPGDSGGPLLTNGTDGYELLGITSLIVGSGNLCRDENGVAVFTYVPSYKDWINDVVSSN